MAFLGSLDIANRALDFLGAAYILSVTEDSKNNTVMSNLYDKCRRIELRSSIWRCATRVAVLRPIQTYTAASATAAATLPTMLLAPAAYSASTTYLVGALVTDANGVMWMSTLSDNLGNTPGGNNSAWESYFGPLTVQPWSVMPNSSTTFTPLAYYAGEMVYLQTGVGSYTVYQSLVNNNTAPPGLATAWNASTVYGIDQVVTNGGTLWRSIIPSNIGNTPAAPPAVWNSTTTYASTNTVTGSDNYVYVSQVNGNTGNNPVTDNGSNWLPQTATAPAVWSTSTGYVQGQLVTGSDSNVYIAWLPSTGTNPVGDTTGTWLLSFNKVAAAWSASFNPGTSSTSWRVINANLTSINIIWPAGVGPSQEELTKNIYRLPAGWLREAPQDPKAGNNTFLGAPGGLMADDWVYTGDFIITTDNAPIPYRFVADIQKVSVFDDLFCDALAARMALDGCETITQSSAKVVDLERRYKEFVTRAKLVNGIDIGPIEPPEDEYLTVRQ
jgi:hypothetical protein